MNCPNCCSNHIVKNGSLGNGKPKFKCNTCGRQFVEPPQKQPISDNTKQLIDKLLLEKIPLAGIARVTGCIRTLVTSLCECLPMVYRQSAACYTDSWEAYKTVTPADQHHPVGKETGQTNKIENFNCLLRQRISRLVRKTLSFSKKIKNYIGAI